jgi:hypothetical protein
MKIYIGTDKLRLNPTWSDALDDVGIEISGTIHGSDNALSSDLDEIAQLGSAKVGTWEYHDKLKMTEVDPEYAAETIVPLKEQDIVDFMVTHPSVFVKPRLSNGKGSGTEDPLGYRTFNNIDDLLGEIDGIFNFWELQKDNGGNNSIPQYAIQEAITGSMMWYVKGVYNGIDEPHILLTVMKEVFSQEDVWLYPNKTRQTFSDKIEPTDDQIKSITTLVNRFIDRIGGRGFFQLQGMFEDSIPKLIDYTPTYPAIIGLFKDSTGFDQGRADRLMFNYAYGNGTLESFNIINTDTLFEWNIGTDLGSDDYDIVKRRIKFLEDNGNIVRGFDEHIKENVMQYYTVLFIADSITMTKEELDLKIADLSTRVLSI